jgi:hypothetical protein
MKVTFSTYEDIMITIEPETPFESSFIRDIQGREKFSNSVTVTTELQSGNKPEQIIIRIKGLESKQ